MTYHILGDEDRDMSSAIVHADSEPDHLRDDGRCPRPGLDHHFLLSLNQHIYLFEQLGVNERAFFS